MLLTQDWPIYRCAVWTEVRSPPQEQLPPGIGAFAGQYTHEDCYAVEHLPQRMVSCGCPSVESSLFFICKSCLKLYIYGFEDVEAGDAILIIDFDKAVLDPLAFDRHVSASSSQSKGSILTCQSMAKIYGCVIIANAMWWSRDVPENRLLVPVVEPRLIWCEPWVWANLIGGCF